MDESYKWNPAAKRQRRWMFVGVYTIVFIIGFIVTYYPILRTGKSFVWWPDGRMQHYPYLIYVGQYLRQIVVNITKGNFSIPLFDLHIGLGEDILGFLNGQGQTDPLLLLSAFVPVKYSEYLYGFLTIFRVYLSGLSFLFLCDYFKKHKPYSLIGSVIYCFSGYAITCSMRHPYFVNPMIVLPLLIVGTDRILKKEHPYIFIFAVFYAALCGYYHLYMMTIMVGIYGLIRFFELHKFDRTKTFLLIVAKGVFGYCLGIGLAAVVFFPGVASFLNAGRSGFSNYKGSYELSYYRTSLLRLIAPPGSWNDMAFAAIVLFALVLLFFSKRRYSLKILTFSAFAILMTSIGGLIMNGFQYSSNRWTFGLVLVASFVVVEMLPELLDMSGKQQLICLIVLGVYVFAALSWAATRKLKYVLVGVAFLSLTAMILMMQIKTEEISRLFGKEKIAFANRKKDIRTFLCLMIVLANIGINGIYKFAPDQGNYASDFQEFGSEISRLEDSTEREMVSYFSDDPEGRADSSSFMENTAMVWKICGMNGYSSITNGNTSEFWDKIENGGAFVPYWIASSDQRSIVNTLLSTKYHVESEENVSCVPYGYALIEKTKTGNLVYENNYALPWGYTYDTVISYNDLDGMNGIEIQDTMLQAIALDNMASNATINTIESDKYMLPYELDFENCEWEDSELVLFEANATITLDFIAPVGTERYVRLAGFDINNSDVTEFYFEMDCGSISKSSYAASNLATWYFGRENYLFNLGYSEEERTSLTITFPSKGTFKLHDIELYALPLDNYPARVEALRAEPLENIEWSTNRLTGTVDLSRDKVLCVSVPYSKGWSAKVDGEKVEILRGNYMFMALPLNAGHHDIELNYFTPGLKLGAALTIVSLGIVIYMYIYDRRKSR